MIIRGKAYWAKIVGDPQPGYDKSKKEWSMDLAIDDETVKLLKKEGLGPKIKNKGDDRGFFISFKRPEIKVDGTKAKPIRIVDSKKALWGSEKIGNGSVVNVSFLINDSEYGGKKFKKPGILAVQVLDLVPYEGGDYEDFEEYSSEDGHDDWSGDEVQS